jgi:hypothetical protein
MGIYKKVPPYTLARPIAPVSSMQAGTRVARRFVSNQNLQIRVNIGGYCNGRCWYILWTFGPFYGLLVYFMDI